MKITYLRKGDQQKQVVNIQPLAINIDGGREILLLLIEIKDGELELTKTQAEDFITEMQYVIKRL